MTLYLCKLNPGPSRCTYNFIDQQNTMLTKIEKWSRLCNTPIQPTFMIEFYSNDNLKDLNPLIFTNEHKKDQKTHLSIYGTLTNHISIPDHSIFYYWFYFSFSVDRDK